MDFLMEHQCPKEQIIFRKCSICTLHCLKNVNNGLEQLCNLLQHISKGSLDNVINYCFRRAGGDRIYGVFDHQLPAALKKLPFDRHLSTRNVQKVVSEADGYQPHLIAPEQGYRRLIDGSISYFKGPAEASVDAVMFLLLLFRSSSFYIFLSV